MTSFKLKINHRQNCNDMHDTTLIITYLRKFRYWITFVILLYENRPESKETALEDCLDDT
jgi:hypothetical protein